jgi:hypothetical protein
MVLSLKISQRSYVAIGIDTRLLSTQLRLPEAIITRSRALKIREIIRPISWPRDSGFLVFSSGGRRKGAEKLLFKCLLLKRKTMFAFPITVANGGCSRRVFWSWAVLRTDHVARASLGKGSTSLRTGEAHCEGDICANLENPTTQPGGGAVQASQRGIQTKRGPPD